MTTRPEHHESLWTLITSPLIWAGHLLLTYIVAAVWCEKLAGSGRSFDEVRWTIFGLTAVALAGIGVNAAGAYRRHRFGNADLPHDEDTPEDRHRFLGFATLLLAGLSALATLFVAAVAVFFRSCD
ncbi:MAG: hypothetical protein R3C59_29915 [Planctomycetaceae bacterium]